MLKRIALILTVLCAVTLACSQSAMMTPVPTQLLPASTITLSPLSPTPIQSLPNPTQGLQNPVLLARPDKPQIGLNFIRFFMEDVGGADVRPEAIFADFQSLGIHTYRQLVLADLLWNVVEPQDDQWDFASADAVLANPGFEPIVTLFAMQYASPTPPWVKDPNQFEKTLGPEAQEYLAAIIERYGPYVKYWELGNEMNHWRAADPGEEPRPGGNQPPVVPADGFSPQDQGLFLAQAAAFIRERDPDAVIVMPGMGGLDEYTLNNWFAGVIEGGGADWFDIVNYHFYPSWEIYGRQRAALQTFIDQNGLSNKPVWLTETGSTASPTLTERTAYPNSPESQAADIFRRIVQAYGAGDALAMWHTYIGSPDNPTNNWRLYGIISDEGELYPSYYAFKLLVQELIPFGQVETLSNDPRGVNAYRITTDAGETRYVLWGRGTYPVPAGMMQITSVISNPDGSFDWQAVPAQIELSPSPVLLK